MGTPRTIRQRLSLLAAVYAAAILANFAIATVLIVYFLRPTLMEARLDAALQQRIERIQSLLRRQANLIEDTAQPLDLQDGYAAAHEEVMALTASLETELNAGRTANLWHDIERATQRHAQLMQETLTRIKPPSDYPVNRAALEVTLAGLGQLWQQAGWHIAERRTQSMARATTIHRRTLAGLMVSTAVCLAICVAGTVLITRWMIEPLDELRKAAVQFAHGNLGYRIPSHTADEIGQLGRELNDMASKIAELQMRRMNRIRFDAASSKVKELDGVVRRPLESIARLATQPAQDTADDEELAASHRTMLDTVDQLKRWLKRLQASTSTIEPMFESVQLSEPLDAVHAAMQATLQQHDINLEIHVDPELKQVEIDRAQIEHALLSLVANAVEASRPGQSVRLVARPVSSEPSRWDLSVMDDGIGIPPEIRERIGRPFFTTKPEGSGFGLLMVNAVAKAHGGALLIESEQGKGSCFTLRLPRHHAHA